MSNQFTVCPLCGSSEVKCQESIKVSDIDELYSRETKISVKSIFGELKTIHLCNCSKCDLQYFYPMVSGTQEFYENLQKFDWYYFDDKPEFDFASQYIKSGDDVLEIGSGKGAFAKKISSNPYTGLEFSQQAISFAKENGILLLAQSIESYAKENISKHDVVCNFQVLEHVSDVNGFLSSSVSCLKPGGLMIVSVPASNSFSRHVRNFCLDMPPHHLTRWSDIAITNLAKQYGLELVTIHHENLQDAHKKFYATTIVANILFRLFRKEYSTIDLSFSSRLIGKLSNVIGSFLSRGLISSDVLPRGLSLVAVYRKSNNG